MLAEIYYEVDEFNKLYLEKIAGYASNINWYPKRKKDLSGWGFGDKGYLMNKEKLAFVEYDGMIDFFAKPRKYTKKEKQKYIPDEAKKMAKKRPINKTVIGLQKGVLDLENTRHRSSLNAFTHMLAAMCAYSFYERKPKVSIQTHKALKQYNGLIAA